MATQLTEQRLCAHCHGPITLPLTYHGIERKYCSITCATAANNGTGRRSRCPDCGELLHCKACGWTPS